MPPLRRYLAGALVVIAPLTGCDSGGRGGRQEPPPAEAVRTYGPARTLGRIETPGLVEASGIVASRREAGTYWVHNDSGDDPLLYCVRSTAASCGAVRVEGAELLDWEDIASGPGGDLYIGDIGDNSRTRSSITVYRVSQPRPPGARGPTPSVPAEPIEYTFPRRAHDAEALLVHPLDGDIFVITKGSPALVFRGSPDGGELVPAAALRLPGLLSLPTGADVSPDGRHVVIGTYDRAFELTVPAQRPFRSVWRQGARPLGLPLARQREAIAYRRDGRAIVTTSEGRRPLLVQRELSRD